MDGKAMNEPRVAVLMGGPSSEHDVSMKSGRQVLGALPGATEVRIERDGAWRVAGERHSQIGAAIDALKAVADVVFVAMHGPFGEDGTVQGLLEASGLAYTGSGVAASSLAMDKVRTKLVYRGAGLPTPDFEVLRPRGYRPELVRAVAGRIGLPAVVKPACNGSSFGVSFPKDEPALTAAVTAHVEQGQDVLVERLVKGRELTCGVLEGEDGGLEALPVTEIVPDARYEFFDYEAKYTPGATDEITPARIDEPLRDRVQALARAAHELLGCRDMSRTDFLVGPDGAPLLIETNTIPGFTPTSLLPQAAAAAGLSFEALVARLVGAAARRRAAHNDP